MMENNKIDIDNAEAVNRIPFEIQKIACRVGGWMDGWFGVLIYLIKKPNVYTKYSQFNFNSMKKLFNEEYWKQTNNFLPLTTAVFNTIFSRTYFSFQFNNHSHSLCWPSMVHHIYSTFSTFSMNKKEKEKIESQMFVDPKISHDMYTHAHVCAINLFVKFSMF